VKLTTTNGVILKSNGTLNNNAAFDATDSGTVSLDDAMVRGLNFVALSHSSFGSGIGVDAGANNSGMNFETTPNGGSVSGLVFGTGGKPCFAMTGTNNTWFNQPCAAVGGGELEDGRTWGNSMFDVHGSTGTAINTYTANHTATLQDSTILVNGIALTITLPDATWHCNGRTYTIKLITNSQATVTTTGGQNIDGSTTYLLYAQNKYVTVQSDGTQWWVVGSN
jgi:hypothetical protein